MKYGLKLVRCLSVGKENDWEWQDGGDQIFQNPNFQFLESDNTPF